MNKYFFKESVVLLSCILLLWSCELAQGAGGYRSSMTAENNRRRDSFTVNGTVSTPSPRYHEIYDCKYQESADFSNGIKSTLYIHLSIRKAGDKLLVVERNDDDKKSIYFIDSTGKLYDFNTTKLTESGRVTPENLGDLSLADITRRSKEINPNNLNEIELKFPFFEAPSNQIGKDAADIHTASGAIWARYIYRGTTVYKGKMSLLYDLVRYVPTLNSMSTVGFLLFDSNLPVPLLVVLDSGSRYSFEQISCVNQS